MRWTSRPAPTNARDADRQRLVRRSSRRIVEPAGPLGRAGAAALRAVADQPRRWQNFKANRRGYWSLWIFLVLFFVSLFAEFIANDKPLFVSFDGKSYFPVLVTYPETDVRRRFRDRRRTIAIPICRS